MKTLTIKRDIIESLDSDERKLEFANHVIALLSDPEKNYPSPQSVSRSDGRRDRGERSEPTVPDVRSKGEYK